MPLLVLILLFTVLPFLEISLLMRIWAAIGWWQTLLLVLGTGVLGAALAKQQGLATLMKLRSDSAAGKLPADALMDGALILVAGAVLITPGVITDAAGFLLLAPPVRQLVKRGLRKAAANRVRVFTAGAQAPPPDERRGDVIDVQVVETRVCDADETEQP